MPRRALGLLSILLFASAADAAIKPRFIGDEGPRTFAVPPILKPNVKLWTAVYGLYDSWQQIYYDTKHLDVILHVLDLRPYLPAGGDDAAARMRKARQRVDAVEATRTRVQAALEQVRRGKRTGLTPLEKQILRAYAGRGGSLASARVGAHPGLRDRFAEGLQRYARYKPYVLEILRRHGLPDELVALAMTESLFSHKARSRSGAYGVWQFLLGTGREYLHINPIVDERRDPIISTDGAARMLKGNIRLLLRWPLALTGYNYGPNGMARAAREIGSHDLVDILRNWQSRRFKFASRNYYASFLAALEVMSHPKRYFPKLQLPLPIRFETVTIPGHSLSVVAQRCRTRTEELAELNPGLTPEVIASRLALPHGYPLRVPDAAGARCLRAFGKAVPTAAKKKRTRAHLVTRGESIFSIARQAGVPVGEVLGLNGLAAPRPLRVGEQLVVPDVRRAGFTFVPVTSDRVAHYEEGPDTP